MPKRWMPYHWQIPLAEGEVPMDKGGFRTIPEEDDPVTMRAIKHAVRTLKKKGKKKDADIYIQCPVAGVKEPMPYQEAWPIIREFFREKGEKDA